MEYQQNSDFSSQNVKWPNHNWFTLKYNVNKETFNEISCKNWRLKTISVIQFDFLRFTGKTKELKKNCV